MVPSDIATNVLRPARAAFPFSANPSPPGFEIQDELGRAIALEAEPGRYLVAESGVAAHWLYKASVPQEENTERLGTKWLQSLLDIQNETRDAAEFWDHVKIDLFPDAVYVFTPKSQILALPRGATIVDFAYAIHSDVGDHTIAAKINGAPVPLRTELHNGDVVEVETAPVSTPNPAWLG